MSNKLVVLGCSHLGHRNADIYKLQKYLDMGADLIDIGDTFEAGVPDKKAKAMEQVMSLDEQYHMGLDMYAGHKVLAKCTSNHSNRVWESIGFDFDKAFCRDLKIPYFEARGQIKWNGYKISFHHGYGSGMNEWKDAKEVLNVYPDSDIVLVSHKHFMAHKTFYNYLNGNRHETHFIRTGSVLDNARYARVANYEPNYPGFSVIEVGPNGLSVDITGRI